MKNHIAEKEIISFVVWHNLRDKFDAEYTQHDLEQFYKFNLPVFVRSNNRNIYGSVITLRGSYVVSNYYRLKRDGTPVRLYVGLD